MKPSQPIDAVIFDHDGTLVDSETITLTVLADIAREAGADVFADGIETFTGADLHVVFAEIEKRSGQSLPDDIFDTFRARQTALILDGLDPIPGAADLLSSISLPMAVASNAPVTKMELCLGATDLLQYFSADRLVSAYDIGLWKPDPAIFLQAAELLGVPPARCAVVEDSKPGVEAGVASGMQVFALDPKDQFRGVAGITQIRSLSELLPYVS